MAQSHTTPLLTIGGLAAAATTGALVAIGRRLGHVGIPFAAIGAAAFHRTVSSGQVGLVFAGLVLHLLSVFVWSAIFLWVLRLWRATALAAIAVASGAFVFSWLVAWVSGAGLSSVLPLGDRLILAVVFAGTLVLGMRFAFLPSQSA